MALVLAGRVAPLGDDQATFRGRVWFSSDGSIEAVTRSGQQAPQGFREAPRVDVGSAIIYPGLIDLHSHLGYNTLPLWSDPDHTTPYAHHDSWPGEDGYPEQISWPAWTLLDQAPECVLAYVQVRALAGGTTSIQGWPNVSRAPTNRLVRCIDEDQVGELSDPIVVSALTQTPEQLRGSARSLSDGRVFVYHCPRRSE